MHASPEVTTTNCACCLNLMSTVVEILSFGESEDCRKRKRQWLSKPDRPVTSYGSDFKILHRAEGNAGTVEIPHNQQHSWWTRGFKSGKLTACSNGSVQNGWNNVASTVLLNKAAIIHSLTMLCQGGPWDSDPLRVLWSMCPQPAAATLPQDCPAFNST